MPRAIERARQRSVRMRQEEKQEAAGIEELIENVSELPTLPSVVTRITAMTSNPQTNAADIGKLISNDPSLSSKILRLVNSAYYGFPRKINSVTKAIVLLGFNKVKNIALSASVVEAFKGAGMPSKFDFYKFWEHSVAVGIAAEVAAKHYSPKSIDDAFVGGLLHDVGKVVIASFTPDESNQIFELAEANKTTFSKACEEVLGIHEGEVGARLSEHWNFPEVLAHPIRYTVRPQSTRQMRDVLGCVHLGDILASALGMTGAGDFAMPLIDWGVWDDLKLDEDSIEQLCSETLVGFHNAQAFLELAS